MIIEFSISNFGPIRDEQILSFEATADDNLNDYYISEPIPGLRLLKLLVLYGPNASGKSTFLKALEFLKNLSSHPLKAKSEYFDFEPFLFDVRSKDETSTFKISFVANKIKYNYEVEFTKHYILRENLKYAPKGRSADLYKRDTNTTNQLTQIHFGSTIKTSSKDIDLIEGNTIWNNTVIGAFNKTNVNIPELQQVSKWFEETLMSEIEPNTNLIAWTTNRVAEDPSFKDSVIKIIKKADVQINDINIEEILSTKNVVFKHFVTDKNGNRSIHNLSSKQESEGTLRYYGLSGVLSTLINYNRIVSIDELETSLHPDLMRHFLLLFLANSHHSQMLITTHNVFLLEERDILRNDTIWFTQKKDNGTTELYSLSDFDTSTIRNTSSIIKSYKAGKLGAIPELGNIFLINDNG